MKNCKEKLLQPWVVKEIVKRLPQAIRKQLPAEIGVIQISAAESLWLNRKYRNKHKPANVLSFLYGPEYGEIVVCPSIIRAEAKVQHHSLDYQMTWMVVHGMIHLAGMHHERSLAVAMRVARIERDILSKLFEKKQEARSKKHGRIYKVLHS